MWVIYLDYRGGLFLGVPLFFVGFRVSKQNQAVQSQVLIVAVAVGIQDHLPGTPEDSVWVRDYELFGNPSFASAMSAICTIIFAYSGITAFFSIVAEMRDPHKNSS
ncbi:hypothetical protein ASPWEDRAFT_30439 [Aspergillus wentii DTO 134E9]|uniref:Amino acid transporter transmembrane domain-containing protein n=1 Tax=Aspergillus wentii DTO 134E9 TaxID=1073089 RepID=A0A1L9REL6_ASPWE|nr:uncharacterized protein ASPWEDRAFT_30439 [Aspergillus wentii DTO 134E9]OJJ33355.1 hypothetical protein ASPWEDRAFT_30439 [Aspergillus wentii DTO 134E9]